MVTNIKLSSVGKIAKKAVCMSVLLTTWHSILSAELTDCFWRFCTLSYIYVQPKWKVKIYAYDYFAIMKRRVK